MKPQAIMRTIRNHELLAVLLASATCTELRAGDVLEISRDTVLDPSKIYEAVVITASNLTLDGRGAWLLGPAAKKIRAFDVRAD